MATLRGLLLIVNICFFFVFSFFFVWTKFTLDSLADTKRIKILRPLLSFSSCAQPFVDVELKFSKISVHFICVGLEKQKEK